MPQLLLAFSDSPALDPQLPLADRKTIAHVCAISGSEEAVPGVTTTAIAVYEALWCPDTASTTVLAFLAPFHADRICCHHTPCKALRIHADLHNSLASQSLHWLHIRARRLNWLPPHSLLSRPLPMQRKHNWLTATANLLAHMQVSPQTIQGVQLYSFFLCSTT